MIAIHSTISDTTAVELAEQLRAEGHPRRRRAGQRRWRAAEKGELAIMVGADRRGVTQWSSRVFKQWASMVVHAGEPGAGTRMKLARNMLTLHLASPPPVRRQQLAEAGGHRPAGARAGRSPHRRA